MNDPEFLERYGPVAIVTGASSGIGASFATLLAARGFELVLVARRLDRLEALAARLTRQYGTGVTNLGIDLRQGTAAQRIFESTAGLDIGLLVSNAGFGFRGPYASADAGKLVDMLAVNCQAPLLLAHSFVPRLLERGRGGIIFTGSVEGLIGCPYSTAYSASKALVKNLGEGLWAELQPRGIDVLTLCPGATDTEAPRRQGIDPSSLAHLMSPDEVARLALENICNGPVYIPSDHYRASFEQLLSLPRDQALRAMAGKLKPGQGNQQSPSGRDF